MPNFYFQFHLVHLSYAGDFDINIWLEVSGILLIQDEVAHLALQELNIFERCIEANVHRQLLSHSRGSCDVVNPDPIQYDIRDLSCFVGLYPLEYRE